MSSIVSIIDTFYMFFFFLEGGEIYTILINFNLYKF